MKYTTLSMLMVLAAMAAVGHSSAIDSSPSQPDKTRQPIGYGSEDLPKGAYILEKSEGLDISEGEALAINGSSPAVRGWPTLLFRGRYIRHPVPNKVHIHLQTWKGHTVITSVSVKQVGLDQGATSQIVAGGVGFTHVTVLMQSAIGRGFDIIMEVYG